MAAEARLRWNSRRNIFPLAFLPGDIILSLCRFLSFEDKSRLSRVNRHFRHTLSSPYAWKGAEVLLRPSKSKPLLTRHFDKILELLATRGIRFVQLLSLDVDLIKRIFNILPDLVGFSIPEVTLDSVTHLQECASRSLRVLHLGKLRMDGRAGCMLANRVGGLLQSLTDIQELSMDLYSSEVSQSQGISSTEDAFTALKSALCACGHLRSLAINGCHSMDAIWIQGILEKNQHMHTLRLRNIQALRSWCPMLSTQAFEAPMATVCPNLKVLDVTGSLNQHPIPCPFYFWFVSSASMFSGITSLNLSICPVPWPLKPCTLSKLPNLEELNLTLSVVADQDLVRLYSTKLKWLELSACSHVTSIYVLGGFRNLQYLGLSNCQSIRSSQLKTVLRTFPELRSLDVSFCAVDDDVLNEWYLTSFVPGSLKLQKLDLTGCAVTQAATDTLRLKTRNSLLIKRDGCRNQYINRFFV